MSLTSITLRKFLREISKYIKITNYDVEFFDEYNVKVWITYCQGNPNLVYKNFEDLPFDLIFIKEEKC
jgi:hypothetical protein